MRMTALTSCRPRAGRRGAAGSDGPGPARPRPCFTRPARGDGAVRAYGRRVARPGLVAHPQGRHEITQTERIGPMLGGSVG